jgi:flagellar biosynthesis protein
MSEANRSKAGSGEAGNSAPNRLAIALQYDFADGAPVVTAKGRGEIADRIIETAREHDIAIEENPVLAEALSQVELDTQIPVPLYRAVAEVIGFVLHTGRLKRPESD